ncbi:MAG TPA: glycoside hydrolase family 88 protein, partial [Chitinophagaceae bacterium]|nr:glycoside hydrolase family 88 protein [Chitinophagaceae bacterium]
DVNHVLGDNFEQGAITIPSGHPIFKSAHKIFMKDISTISVKAPARVVLSKNSDNIIAVSSYGKGIVFAIGDPWLYNEYVNGRLPEEFQNYAAANDLVKWLMEQVHH